LGILIQTIAQTAATLGVFAVGLLWHLHATNSVPADSNPFFVLFNHDWKGVDVNTAETMAFVTLSMCELFRSFTCRSERLSIFQIGVFSNPWLVGAFLFSASLLVPTVLVPSLNSIFETRPLALTEWGLVIGFALIPALTEEITKWILRRKG